MLRNHGHAPQMACRVPRTCKNQNLRSYCKYGTRNSACNLPPRPVYFPNQSAVWYRRHKIMLQSAESGDLEVAAIQLLANSKYARMTCYLP